jgi:hypothetical protein
MVKSSKIDNFGTQKEMPGFYIKRDILETMSKNGGESERISVLYRGMVSKGMLSECLLQNGITIALMSRKKNQMTYYGIRHREISNGMCL